MSVEELTALVAEQQWRRPKDFDGVSDHLIHLQLVRLQRQDSSTVYFLAGTFNVLAEIHMWWQNGIRTDGKPVPEWYNIDNQQGLQRQPLSDPNNKERRRDAIISLIQTTFNRNPNLPAVLCLQECSREIAFAIRNSMPELDVIEQFSETDSRLVTICRKMGTFGGSIFASRAIMTPVELGDFGRFYIVNCHLEFATAKNEMFFDELKRLFRFDQPLLVMGDFNIPAMPISDKAKNEGSTKTIAEMVNQHLVGKHHFRYAIARHPQGFTNWNCRMNCADPEANADHMDNILFLHDGSCAVTFEPRAAPDPGRWWE